MRPRLPEREREPALRADSTRRETAPRVGGGTARGLRGSSVAPSTAEEPRSLFTESRAAWHGPTAREVDARLRAEESEPPARRTRRYVPRSVAHCGGLDYAITTWRVDGEGEPETERFRCRSWRCPRCRRAVAFQDYARIACGIGSRALWVYLVLTMPAEARELPLWQRYVEAKRRWRGAFRKGLVRRWGKSVYVQTWEAHRDGTPHLNLCLSGEAAERMIAGGKHGRVLNARGELRDLAVRSGFGPVLWVEPAWTPQPGSERPLDGLASYLVKCWHSLGGSGPLRARGKLAAELARAEAKAGDQTPIDAPRRFRRFSASPGLLPARIRGGKVTGAVHADATRAWTWDDVRRWEEKRERSAIRLLELAERIDRLGLPLPAWVDRVRPHGQPEEAAGKGRVRGVRRSRVARGDADAQESARAHARG